MAWFPVHCTSINNTNSLISGDNKGAASQMFERHAHSRSAAWLSPLVPCHIPILRLKKRSCCRQFGVSVCTIESEEPMSASVLMCHCSAAAGDATAGDFDPAFVAGFGQANVGDTSPNTLGAFCQDTGRLPTSCFHCLGGPCMCTASDWPCPLYKGVVPMPSALMCPTRVGGAALLQPLTRPRLRFLDLSHSTSCSFSTHSASSLPAGEPCSPEHSTCNGRNELCVGRGPGWPDHFVSNEIIGRRQFEAALQLWNSTEAISGASTPRCWLGRLN